MHTQWKYVDKYMKVEYGQKERPGEGRDESYRNQMVVDSQTNLGVPETFEDLQKEVPKQPKVGR